MKKNTAAQRAASSARPSSTHRIPLRLQIAAKLCDAVDHDHSWMLKRLAAADAEAIRLLEDPLIRLETDGANAAVAALAEANGAQKTADELAAMIPASATHDPHRYIVDNAVCWASAGLYLGLCLGWRLTAALSDKDSAR